MVVAHTVDQRSQVNDEHKRGREVYPCLHFSLVPSVCESRLSGCYGKALYRDNYGVRRPLTDLRMLSGNRARTTTTTTHQTGRAVVRASKAVMPSAATTPVAIRQSSPTMNSYQNRPTAPIQPITAGSYRASLTGSIRSLHGSVRLPPRSSFHPGWTHVHRHKRHCCQREQGT